MLTVASLLSILFMTFHLTSDTLHARIVTPEAGVQPLHPALLAELYLPEICQGPIRDCGRMTGNPDIIG